jgi:uncharacterized protein YdeI (BOF family)
MQTRNRFNTEPGLLCSIIFTAAFFIAVFALRPQLGRSQPLAQKIAQQIQDKPNAQQQQPTPPDQPAATAVVVTGTIAKSGDNFVLRDTSGTVYQLDAQDKAQPYEGKSVKVTGKLEAETKLLHVETIEELSA